MFFVTRWLGFRAKREVYVGFRLEVRGLERLERRVREVRVVWSILKPV